VKETNFWGDRLKPGLEKRCKELEFRHFFNRVENRVHEGDPDVDYCIAGVSGKIELKYQHRHPLRGGQVLGKGNGMRRSQIIFAARWCNAGGLLWLMVGTQLKTWCIDLRKLDPWGMEAIEKMTPDELDAAAAWHAGPSVDDGLPYILVACRRSAPHLS